MPIHNVGRLRLEEIIAKDGRFKVVDRLRIDQTRPNLYVVVVSEGEFKGSEMVLRISPVKRDDVKHEFEQMIKIGTSLRNNPHILDVYEVKPWVGGYPSLLMELGDYSLEQYILSDQRNLNESMGALHHVLTGLMALHKLGYVHRDIKPSNI
ncbi:hypothetical protein DRJ48_03910, partial [Candidatus Woesearchaeota archaeon]